MKTQTVKVIQQITITYNCEEAKQKCIKQIEKSTNWMAFSEGTVLNKELQYSAAKTDYIEVIE